MYDINSIRPCWLEVDLDVIANNIQIIKNYINNKNTILNIVVKANGNGHGAVQIAKVAIENGIKQFAVAILDEAIELREAGIKENIQILGLTPNNRINDIIKYKISPTVDTLNDAQMLAKYAEDQNEIININIKINTGLNRIGFSISESSIHDIQKIYQLKNVNIFSIFSHFASSDNKDKNYTKLQYRKFTQFCKDLEDSGIVIPLRHIANSAAIIDHKYTYLDMVRTGTLLYGFFPSADVSRSINIHESASLKSKIVHIHEISPNDYVGYGCTFKAKKMMKIAVVPIGYADGYPREFSGKFKVLCNGEIAPIIGRICMDQMVIDISNIQNVNLGDEIVLYGHQGNNYISFDEAAKSIGTINIDLSSRISRRVPRVYLRNGKIHEIQNYLKH